MLSGPFVYLGVFMIVISDEPLAFFLIASLSGIVLSALIIAVLMLWPWGRGGDDE